MTDMQVAFSEGLRKGYRRGVEDMRDAAIGLFNKGTLIDAIQIQYLAARLLEQKK